MQGIMLLILVGFGECHPNSYNSLGWGSLNNGSQT